jgi:UDP-glucose 4-epimerase
MSANVLVTGSSGYIGRLLVEALATRGAEGRMGRVVAADVREPERLPASVTFVRHDVRDDGLADVLRRHDVTCVVHLASIVTPPKGSTRAVEYAVEVQGSRRVLDACIAANVRRLVVTSSGAAYGYHADNPAWLAEDAPLRGNESFAYSWHKRLVEEMLADCRVRHPSLEQVIFRVGRSSAPRCTTDHRPCSSARLAIRGSDSPCFHPRRRRVVVSCAVDAPVTGIFNVAGDGALSIREIAALLGKPVLTLPAWLLQGALAVARPLGLTRYGPEQVDFLRYRPVLDNARLKREFGYVPALTSREAFDRWRERGRADTGR